MHRPFSELECHGCCSVPRPLLGVSSHPIIFPHNVPHPQQNTLILGLGASGYWAAQLARRQGAVCVVDAGSNEPLQIRAEKLRRLGIKVLLSASEPPDQTWSQAIVSPGISAHSAWVAWCKHRQIPLTSELAFAANFVQLPMLAVTGTNGKTTTVQIATHMLRMAGVRACAAGNIGVPLSQLVLEDQPLDAVVLEVSSFQLELGVGFRPTAAAWLNLASDHIDRHGSMLEYARLKRSLVESVADNGQIVLPVNLAPEMKATRFSAEPHPQLATTATTTRFPAPPSQLPGKHNAENALAATALVQTLGVAPEQAWASLQSFSLGSHRLEIVAKQNGIAYVNDSKSTNPDSVARALETVGGGQNVLLIAGGRDKAMDFDTLLPKLRHFVREAHLIGENRSALSNCWSAAVHCSEHTALDSAVDAASRAARNGDVVLFSPGCASHDMFTDYKQRGASFVAAIKRREIA